MHPDLLPHLATNQKIRVSTDISDDPVFGYLLSLSDDLALFHAFADFDPDGYIIIRTADVDEVRRSEHEAFWDQMLAAEKLLSGLIRPPEINIDSIRSAINSVASLYPQMIILSERTDEEGDLWEVFNIGSVVEIHEDLLEFRTYDSLGVWEEKPRTIWYSDITTIKFDTRYANIFWRHIQPRPPI